MVILVKYFKCLNLLEKCFRHTVAKRCCQPYRTFLVDVVDIGALYSCTTFPSLHLSASTFKGAFIYRHTQ